MSNDAGKIRECAIGLLSRREHSAKELRDKLTARGFETDLIIETLGQLQSEGLQSDHRYTESFLHSRMEKGYGPLRITRELREKGIPADLVNSTLAELDPEWSEILTRVRIKKFGNSLPSDYKEQARQSRFLNYRGFSNELIRDLFNTQE